MSGAPGERRLVVTGDDLGRDPAGTATLCALWEEGLITAASMITVGQEAERTAGRLRAAGLTPRLHLTLTSERGLPPWRPLTGGASLHDEHGWMPEDARRLGHALDLDEVREEFDAQLGWMHVRGLRPRGADFHTAALYALRGGELLEPTLRWCALRGLGFRLPRRLEPFPGTAVLSAPSRRAHTAALHLADELGVPLPAALLAHRTSATSCDALREELVDGLAGLPTGTSELLLHPSGPGPSVPAERPLEAALLRDPRWREALDAHGIRTVPHW